MVDLKKVVLYQSKLYFLVTHPKYIKIINLGIYLLSTIF
jgi:hypothetical protein